MMSSARRSSGRQLMTNLRCTARAIRRFKMDVEDGSEPSNGVLGDWYVNLLNLGPTRFVLCVSEKSLLPVVVPARNSEFPSRLPAYVERMLLAIGLPADQAAVEAAHCLEVRVGKTRNRSILGVMNDYKQQSNYYVVDIPSLSLSLALAETPGGTMGFANPMEKTWEIFEKEFG